jgi:hypothetical protein
VVAIDDTAWLGGLEGFRSATATWSSWRRFCGRAAVRLVSLNDFGYNTDEAAHGPGSGDRADRADPALPGLPAHPLLIQFLRRGLWLWCQRPDRTAHGSRHRARHHVWLLLGRLLYGRAIGLLAAAILALMPYHVLVSRQMLLDGPMTFFATRPCS